MKNLLITTGLIATVLFTACETECPECIECELDHTGQLTEWGEHVKAELVSLFLDLEDIALCQVWSADSQTRHWSGYGSNGEDSREIQVDFLDTELVLVFTQFVNGKWSNSMIRIPYDMVISTVLQYVTHLEGGMVVRRANNVLIYMSNEFDPDNFTDGISAMSIAPTYLKVSHEKLIIEKFNAPAS